MAATPEEVAEAMLNDALQPLKIEGDLGKIEERTSKDKIDAINYSRSIDAATENGFFGMRVRKIVPPNAIGSSND